MSAIKLRDYQKQDVIRIRDAFTEHRRVCYVLPTGGGKTAIAVRLMIQQWVCEGKTVLVVAHRCEIIDQMVAALIRDGLDERVVGVIRADDKRTNPGALVQVASVATLIRRREMPPAELLVFDECHHAPAKSWMTIAERYPESLVLGLSATPQRIDGRGLGDVFDVIVHGPLFSELVEMGVFMVPRVFTPAGALPSLDGVHTTAGDFNLEELGIVMNKRRLIGDIPITYKKHAEWRRAIVFAVNVKHSKRIAQSFNRAGIRAEHVDHETSPKERAAILARFRSGETLILCNVMLFAEGWDCPEAKCVILARPTKSPILFNQQAGRIVRMWTETSGPSKGQIIPPMVLDHAGNCARFNRLPHADRRFVLTLTKGANGGKAPMKQCEACECWAHAGTAVCPNCDEEFPPPAPVEELDGELVEINPWPEEARKAEYERMLERAHQIESVKDPMALATHLYKLRFGKVESWMSPQR